MAAAVSAATPQKNIHYRLLESPLTDSESTETSEPSLKYFFWYGCASCYQVALGLEQWLANRGEPINFTAIPVILRPDWRLQAHTYYTLVELGIDKQEHLLFYDAWHSAQFHLRDEQTLTAYFTGHGVAKETFLATLYSTSVNQQVKNAQRLQKNYGIEQVPAIILNERYFIDVSMVDSTNHLLAILDYLVSQSN